jgi:hypothetical protein
VGASESLLPVALWINHAFSNVYNFCQLLRPSDQNKGFPGGLKIYLSHDNPQFVARNMADEFFLESQGRESYVDWAIEIGQKNRINLLWAFREARNLAERARDLAKIGVTLMVCASPDILDILNDKAAFYAHIDKETKRLPAEYSDLLCPRHRVVGNLEAFSGAVKEFEAQGYQVSFKPAQAIYAQGFKIIVSPEKALKAYMSSDPYRTTLAEAEAKLAQDPVFRRLLVMETLPGPEYSVDVLAKEGRLIRATIRLKPQRAGSPEKLVYNETILALAQKLTKMFQLSHIFNLQLMDSPEGLKILEINPRAAGGLYYSALGGINYPYWAARLALGASEDLIPEQAYDLWVAQAYQPFVYETA